MALIRWLLIALSAGLGIWVIGRWVSSSGRIDPAWPGFVIPAGCALNIYYLYMSSPQVPSKKSRLIRLAHLWLDAKEEELKRRGKSNEKISN